MLIPIVLLIIGIVLVLLEMMLPSAGILGILAAVVLIGAVTLAFRVGTNLGLYFTVGLVVLLPILIVVGLRMFPHTPVGKRLTLTPTTESPEQRGAAVVADEDFSKLYGQRGLAVTPLRPSGIAEIGGQRYSVVARGQIIDAGKLVEVTEVEGNSIVVDEVA